jgi:hypothetical protein
VLSQQDDATYSPDCGELWGSQMASSRGATREQCEQKTHISEEADVGDEGVGMKGHSVGVAIIPLAQTNGIRRLLCAWSRKGEW